MMKKQLTMLCAAALSLSLLSAARAEDAPSAQNILAAVDKIRNPQKSFGLTVELIEYRNGSERDHMTLSAYSSPDEASGIYRTLIQFVAPPRDANKLMLKNGNDLWFYDPQTQSSILIAPQQRLLGQAANGDVLTVNLAHDYKAQLDGSENITDGDRQTRDCYKLQLTGTAPDVTYPRIEYWVDQHSDQPVKAQFYTDSGTLLKTAYYRHYQENLGAERPSETIIIDGLDHNWITVIRDANYAWRDIPDGWFQKDFLPRFRPQ